MKDHRIYQIALGLIPNVGGKLARTLVSYTGSPEMIFSLPKGKLKKIPGIGEATAVSITDKLLFQAEQHLSLAEKTNTRIVFYTDPEYPDRLKHIPDAPAVLYFRGNCNLNHPRIIAIVGTRNITGYGKEVTEEIIKKMKIYQPMILSGLAYGVDHSAHQAAIKYELPTIGVMATGPDIIYPAPHKQLAMQMCSNGGLLTEYPFSTKADPPRFPARNRIIAGLCDAVIVVEAAKKGGALITAEMANDYNREVFAVPGSLHQTYSEGCNLLIRNHKANIYTSPADLEYILNWDMKEATDTLKEKEDDFSSFTDEEQEVLKNLGRNEGIHIDQLSWKSNISISRLACLLLNLEFQGVVKSLPGKKYKLLK